MFAAAPTADYVRCLLADPSVRFLLRHRLGAVEAVDAIANRSPVFAVRAGGSDYIVRFPVDAEGLAMLRKEEAVQRGLRPRVTLAIPDTEVVAPPDGVGLPCFAIHTRIPGGDVYAGTPFREMPAHCRERLVDDLGTFFAQTHAVPLAEACRWLGVEYGGPGDLARLAALYGKPAWFSRDAAVAMRRALEPHLPTALLDVLTDTAARFDALPCLPELMVFGHGDLHGGNMAIVDDGDGPRLTGVFDLGNAAVLDVHEDFFRLNLVDEQLWEETVARYQVLTASARPIDPERVEVYYRAFLYYLMGEGVRFGDAAYIEHMRGMIERHLGQPAETR